MSAPTTNTTIHSVHIASVTINVSSPGVTLDDIRAATYRGENIRNPTTISDAPDVGSCATAPADAAEKIADAVGIPPKTARKLINRGLKKLKRSGSTSRSRKR